MDQKKNSLSTRSSSKKAQTSTNKEPDKSKKQNVTQKDQDAQEENKKGNYTQFSKRIFKGNNYMEKFISKVATDKFALKCLKCKDEKGKLGKVIQVNSLKPHLLSNEHLNNTPQEELEEYNKLKALFKEENKDSENHAEKDIPDKTSKDFLSFISFLTSQRLSFSQIEAIGKFLQKGYKEKRLKFLSNSMFDQRFLSKVVQDCFKTAIEEDLKEKLANCPYSLIIDNSTLLGTNICALKVKYLDKEWREEYKEDVTTVKNKVIALTDLEESSSGISLNKIIENKLFCDERIKRNFIGLAHDNGSSLVGENIGLCSLLQKENHVFFDLRDPCHGLNLVLKHSLKSLPDEITQFVENISNHFSSPQRKAFLKKVQQENEEKILYPKKLAMTRWLSMGDSLKRIIEIWGSLSKYFDILVSQENPLKIKKKKKKSIENAKSKNKGIQKLLKDQMFYVKIQLMSHIINTLNKYNIRLQNQKSSVSELKKNINECYYSFLELVLTPSHMNMDFKEFLNQDWEDWSSDGKKRLKKSEKRISLKLLSVSKFIACPF